MLKWIHFSTKKKIFPHNFLKKRRDFFTIFKKKRRNFFTIGLVPDPFTILEKNNAALTFQKLTYKSAFHHNNPLNFTFLSIPLDSVRPNHANCVNEKLIKQ